MPSWLNYYPVALAGNIKICRDLDDNLVLETAIVGKAEYLVTRDDDIKRDVDLIKAMKDKGAKVLTVSQFLRHLKEKSL